MVEETTEGTTVKSKIIGYIYSTSGNILNGAKVTCNGFETLTLADGLYVFDALTPGTFEVRVSLQGFHPESKKVSITEDRVEILDFHLSTAVGTAKISGKVYDSESGKPILNGGNVILILPVSNRYINIDETGRYEFDSLPAGTYKLYLSIPDYEERQVVLTIVDGESKAHDFLSKIQKVVEPAWG